MAKFSAKMLKRRVVEALDMPKDLTLGLPIITMTGDEEVVVSSHQGLLEYGAGHVRLATAAGGLKIFGTNMTLREISVDAVAVVGKIDRVIWEA